MTQQPHSDEVIVETLRELEQQLRAVSSENHRTRPLWRHQGQSYRDDLVRVFVDVPDTPENRRFFEEYKEHLKTRFRQLDMWMTTYLIEVL
jgi:hypothetical protein